MQTNASKQLLNKLKCSKFQNTDVNNFTMYFIEISFVECKGKKVI